MQYSSFEQFLTISRGLQPVTIQDYVSSIRRMKSIIGEDPSHEQMNEYIHKLYSSNLSYSHKTNTALALERWSEYKGVPLKFGRQKKPRQIVKETLTEAEVTRLIFSAKSIRDKTMVSLLAYSGCRNKELCSLKVRDFDPGRNTIRIIKGKGIKDGLVNISSACTNIILNYLQKYPRQQDDFLFETYQKNPMTTCSVRKQVKVMAQKAELKKRVYPHLLRHTLAANLLLRGANIMLLKQQLRHAHLETTLVYINSIVFGETNQYDKFAPSYL